MQRQELTFHIPLPRAWSPAQEVDDAFAQVKLTPGSGAFEVTPIGGLLQGPTGLAAGTVQWRAALKKSSGLKAAVTLDRGLGAARSRTVEGTLDAPLELDYAEVGGEGRLTLLRGSVRIPLEVGGGPFARLLAPLWPLPAAPGAIVALRVEPAGLHLEGRLPAALFPPGTAQSNGEVVAVLRVPQQVRDITPAGDAHASKPFWTLPAFDFGTVLSTALPTAASFLLKYAEAIEAFGRVGDEPPRSFVDNVAAAPGAESVVRIMALDAKTLEWVAPGLRQRLRVQLGGGAAGEAAFFPDEMRGRVVKQGGKWRRAPVGQVSGAQHPLLLQTTAARPGGAHPTARLSIGGPAFAATLQLENQQLIPLSLPALPLEPPAPPRPHKVRSWLCTDSGWLALDADAPAAPRAGAGAGAGAGEGAVRGVIEVEKIMAALTLAGGAEGLTDADALQVQLSTGSATSVLLGVDFGDAPDGDAAKGAAGGAAGGGVTGLHLFLHNPATTVFTPALWVGQTPADAQSPGEAQPVAAQLLPSLSALSAAESSAAESSATGSGEATSSAAATPALLQRATFVSPPSPTPAGAPATGVAAQLHWEKDRFTLALRAPALRLWHPFPDLPLAQTFSRTPDPNRDSFLDANRGLLPLVPADQTATVEFPLDALAALPSVKHLPATWRTLDGWALQPSRLPTRYFLPTLPGVEATLPLEGDGRMGPRWGYRHAVPALDEAYAEVVEEPQQGLRPVQAQGGLDFTRVEGAEAFAIKVGAATATGWLLKSESNPRGELPLTITTFAPEGRAPTLGLTIPNAEPASFQLSRTENPAGLSATLAGEPIARGGQSLAVNGSSTRDGEGRQVEAITTVQPATTLKSVGQDAETLWTGRYARSIGRGNWDDALALELMGVRLGALADDADPGSQRWMLHDGGGDWPCLRGWPLYPLALRSLRKEGGGLTAELEVILLPRTPAPPLIALDKAMVNRGLATAAAGTNLDGRFTLTLVDEATTAIAVSFDGGRWPAWPPRLSLTRDDDASAPPVTLKQARFGPVLECTLEAEGGRPLAAGDYTLAVQTDWPESAGATPPFAHGRLLLTLALHKDQITDVAVAPVAGQDGFDWRFAAPDSAPDSAGPSPARLRGAFALTDTDSTFTLTGLELRHPLGMIELDAETLPTEPIAGFQMRQVFRVEQRIGDFSYMTEIVWRPADLANPYQITFCEFHWRKSSNDGTQLRLDYYAWARNGWFATVERNGQELVGSLALELHAIDRHRFLFGVKPGQAPDSGDARAWLKPEAAAGALALSFSPDRRRITSLVAELQLSLRDRYPNDAVLLWDPTRDVLHTMDRNVGRPAGGALLPGIAGKHVARDAGLAPEIVWADQSGRVRRWRQGKENNEVYSFDALGEDKAIAVAAPTSDPTSNQLVVVVADPSGRHKVIELLLDADDADRADTLTPDQLLGEGDNVLALVTGQPAVSSSNAVAWATAATTHLAKRVDATPLQVASTGSLSALAIATLEDDETRLVEVRDGVLKLRNAEGNLLKTLRVEFRTHFFDLDIPLGAAATILNNWVVLSAYGALGLMDVAQLQSAAESEIELEPQDWGVVGSLVSPVEGAHADWGEPRSIVPLGEVDGRVHFAVLYRRKESAPGAAPRSTVMVFDCATNELGTGAAWRRRQVDPGQCVPTQISFMRRSGSITLLVLSGPTPASRLAAQLLLDEAGLHTELTGRLTIQNALDYSTQAECSHRIDLYFDHAAAPAEAIFWSRHPAATDAHTAALAQHTFRFPDGKERVWQAPQMVRFTSLQRFAPLARIDPAQVAEAHREELVLDASAVFWLQPAAWAEERRYGVGAAAITNQEFGVWLLPRELRSFETGRARAVRLPAVGCWAFDNAPFEARAESALKAPAIAIGAAIGPAAVGPALEYGSSGAQPALLRPAPPAAAPLPGPDHPLYFRRSDDAAWLDAGFLGGALHNPAPAGAGSLGVRPAFGEGDPKAALPDAMSDLLWLKDQLTLWLHQHVRLFELEREEENAPIDAAGLLAAVEARVTAWRDELPPEADREDRAAFLARYWAVSLPRDSVEQSFRTWLAESPLADSLRPDFVRGDSAFLASATLTHQHNTAAPGPLIRPALFEFPYRLRLEAGPAQERTEGTDEKFDVQLVVVDGGKAPWLKRLAHDRIAVAAGAAQSKAEAALTWARTLMEERRRFDAAYVLLDFATVIPVPRRFEAAYAELPLAQDDPLGAEEGAAPDPRCRLPIFRPHGPGAGQHRWLEADATLGLRLFAATPAAPTDPEQKIVAATRFRLAPAAAQAAPLAPARVEQTDTAPPSRSILALSQRDEAPFEVYTNGTRYARPDGEQRLGELPPALTEQGALAQPPAEAEEKTAEEKAAEEKAAEEKAAEEKAHGRPASLLPPLVDVVSWAARPGEMLSSAWVAGEHRIMPGARVDAATRARHPVAATLRRPRAQAGAHEAVRLLPPEGHSTPALTPLFHKRFVRADFSLQQDLDRTTPNELVNHVQMVVATRTEIFKSAATHDQAVANPARPPTGAERALYLIATEALWREEPAPDANVHLALRSLPAAHTGSEEETKAYFDLPEVEPSVLWRFASADEFTAGALRRLRIDLPSDQDTATTLLLVRYEKSDMSFKAPVTLAALVIQPLTVAGQLVPPKMSVSLLAAPQPGPVSLVGYGRLGPEDFALVAPRERGAALIWSRTAALRVIHRNRRGEPPRYDVVVYGPGGELIRTEEATAIP